MSTKTTALQLKKMPAEVNDILIKLQAKKLIDRKVLISKEQLIYQIVKEYGKQNALT